MNSYQVINDVVSRGLFIVLADNEEHALELVRKDINTYGEDVPGVVDCIDLMDTKPIGETYTPSKPEVRKD